MGAKSLRISFDKIHGFISVSGGTIYLVSFGAKKYHSMYNRIRCLIGVKRGIKYVISHNYARFKVDS